MIICLFNTGLTVVIRCPDSNNTNSTTGGTALPKFAIRGMLKTFGLHGVVLDVDSVSTILYPAVFCHQQKLIDQFLLVYVYVCVCVCLGE